MKWREERQESEYAWSLVLSLVGLFFLVFGIWAATQSHNWTPLWPLNVLGGLASYGPCVLWVVYGSRLPNHPLVLWPARAIALIAAIAIPFLVWGPVPPPPPPPPSG